MIDRFRISALLVATIIGAAACGDDDSPYILPEVDAGPSATTEPEKPPPKMEPTAKPPVKKPQEDAGAMPLPDEDSGPGMMPQVDEDAGTDPPPVIAEDSGTGTISPEAGPPAEPPTLSVADASGAEGQDGTSDLTFKVTLSAASDVPVSVAYATVAGTADPGGLAAQGGRDYASTSGTLVFAPGVTEQMVSVKLNGDLLNEADETFSLRLLNSLAATIADGEAVGTIENDDAVPGLTVADVTVDEKNTGTSVASVTVTLSAASALPVTVDWTTMDGTALAGQDFVANQGKLTFAIGQTSKTAQITINGDALDEADEQFTVELAGPTNATLTDGVGAVTISDDDATPTLSIASLSIAEGTTGTSNALLIVTLSAPSGRAVTVDYATADGTATAGVDYTAASGTLSFDPGDTVKSITVVVTGDDGVIESDETATVTLSNPTNATVATGAGTLTLLNDDGEFPRLSVDNVTVAEGNSGTATMTFTVTMDSVSAGDITVDYATVDGTALVGGEAGKGGADYVAASGTLTFAPGELTKTVDVTVNGDALNEGDETLTLNLSLPGGTPKAVISDPQGVGTISDDDAMPSVSIGDVSIVEGAAGTRSATFALTLSAPAGRDVIVDFETADETATAGDDYVAATGSVTIDAGKSFATLSVAVNGDLLNEGDDTFLVTLTNPQNASIAVAQAVGTITNDDDLPVLSIGVVSIGEGDSGTTTAVIAVSLSAESGRDVMVDWATADDTATAGADYVAGNGTLTLAAGSTTEVLTVLVNGDIINEGNEQFFVDLTTPVNATIGTARGTVTIVDNDSGVPGLTIDDMTVDEGDTESQTVTLTVTLSLAIAQTVTVDYALAGTASVTTDYTAAATGTLTFVPDALTQTIAIEVLGDTRHELDETVTVTLSNATNAYIDDGEGVVNIDNDDDAPTMSIADVTIDEDDGDPTAMTFTVSLNFVSDTTITASYNTVDDTATEAAEDVVGDDDYDAVSGVLTFAPGDLTKTITVTVNPDDVFEEAETLFVRLSDFENVSNEADLDGTGTITNDEDSLTLSIDDVTVVEGTSENSTLTFTVTLSGVSASDVTVDYTTGGGDATVVLDYVLAAASLTFAPGETTKTIAVTVVADALDEPDETFDMTLSNADGATLPAGPGVGTITDDDPT